MLGILLTLLVNQSLASCWGRGSCNSNSGGQGGNGGRSGVIVDHPLNLELDRRYVGKGIALAEVRPSSFARDALVIWERVCRFGGGICGDCAW